MSTHPSCDDVERHLEESPGGVVAPWAEEHLRACSQCAAAARADARLREMLAAVPQEPPRPQTWDRVAARRGVRMPGRRRAWRPALALTAATAAVLAAAVLLRPGPVPLPTPGPAPMTTAETTAPSSLPLAVEAHAMLSASDTTADPNRAVLLMALSRAAGGATP